MSGSSNSQVETIPWWAVSVLDYEKQDDLRRVRLIAQAGCLGRIKKTRSLSQAWDHIVEDARKLERSISRQAFVQEERELARFGALECPRAFVEFCQILDDTLKVPTLKDFHVQTVRAMRTQKYVELLLPFAHGKSWLSSIVVPLMDFAEEPEFTQARIYFNKEYAKYWIRKLMFAVEHTDDLHKLFPWVARPERGNPVAAIWSTDGFCIQGKKAMDPNFEGFGVGQATGRRFWRVGCDDWVVSDTAASEKVNGKQWDYFHTGPMSMTKPVPFKSHHGTRAPSTFVVGTLFDKRDFNYQLANEWRQLGYRVRRVDIYANRDKTEVIWPEERPLEWVEQQKLSMGDVAFQLRCRNIVLDDTEARFKEKDVDAAMDETMGYGDPMGYPCLIGFDPASGKRSRQAKYPAAVLCSFDVHKDEIHVVKYERWNLPMPRQIERLSEWSTTYICPVAVEDVSQQIVYAQWMNQIYPDVKVISHSTDKYTKRDWAQGVESLIPYFENGKIKIHTGGAPGQWTRALREELVNYPQSTYTDLLMALWICKYQFQLRQKLFSGKFESPVPSYARRGTLTTTINLKALRERSRQSW